MILTAQQFGFTLFEGVGWLLFLTAFLIQIYFYLKYFLPLLNHEKSKSKKTYGEFVSVVVAARNEEATIVKLIEKLVAQDYPNFEIIVVNDHSTDSTWKILNELQLEQVHIFQNIGVQSKKSALTAGIKAARAEVLLFTDADCWPNSKQWIAEMVGNFSPNIEIVLGFGAFQKADGWLNKLIRFEGFLTALQCFGFAKAGKAYMGVGRNLAYRKSTFLRLDGFVAHDNVMSGDDDLFVNSAASTSNVEIELNEASFTCTEGESQWNRFIAQKRRQLSAGAKYKPSDKVRLALFGASSFLYYSLFVTLYVLSPFSHLILGIFVFKQILEYLLFSALGKQFKVGDLMPLIVILEPLYIFCMTAIGVSTWFWKVKEWK